MRRITADDDAARAQRLELLRGLAGLQVRSGHDDVAAGTLERMLEIDPDRLEARSELGDALARQGQFDRAIAEYDRILAAEPRNVPTLVKRATARINAGLVEPGLRDFEQAVAAAPGEPAIRLRYAEALDRLGRSGAAAAQRAAAGGASQSGDVADRAHFLAEQGRRAVAAGRYDEAITAFQQAIEAAPGDGAARLELARVLGHVGRFDEADAEFMRVIAASPRDENAWRGHVLSLLLAGKLEETKVALRDALRVFPRSSSLANALARLLATATADDVRDSALALDLAQRVHQVHGDSSSAETLAAAMADSGRFAEAVALQRPVVAAMGETATARARPRASGQLRARSAVAAAHHRRDRGADHDAVRLTIERSVPPKQKSPGPATGALKLSIETATRSGSLPTPGTCAESGSRSPPWARRSSGPWPSSRPPRESWSVD